MSTVVDDKNKTIFSYLVLQYCSFLLPECVSFFIFESYFPGGLIVNSTHTQWTLFCLSKDDWVSIFVFALFRLSVALHLCKIKANK